MNIKLNWWIIISPTGILPTVSLIYIRIIHKKLIMVEWICMKWKICKWNNQLAAGILPAVSLIYINASIYLCIQVRPGKLFQNMWNVLGVECFSCGHISSQIKKLASLNVANFSINEGSETTKGRVKTRIFWNFHDSLKSLRLVQNKVTCHP